MSESIVTLRVEARNAISSLNRTTQATRTLSDSAKGTTTSLAATSTAANSLGTALRNSIAPIIAVGSAFTVLNGSINTFLARERDISILEQGISNLGAGAHSLRELQEVADRFGKTTLFNQEDFTRGFNLLTSFRNIGVDAYERVAQAAADIAQVNQVDVSTSFMQLAKALQDPERNLSNLNRSGIAFTKQQTEVIKKLMQTNRIAEALTMILDIVDDSYNKLAQAAAEGFAGSVDTLGESFRDFGESIGRALVPVLDPTVKGFTAILNFLNSEGGQATAILGGIALAAKGISVAVPLAVAGLSNFVASAQAAAISSYLTATGLKGMAAASFLATGGITQTTVALHAFKLAMVKTGIGALVIGLGFLATAILKAKNAQREFNDLLNTGTAANINKRLEITRKKITELSKELNNVGKGRGGKAEELRINRQLDKANKQAEDLKKALEAAEARELTAEFDNQLDSLKKQNSELTNAVKRSKIRSDEKKKEFDLDVQIAAIRKEFSGEEADRLVSLAKQNHELGKQKDEIDKINKAAKEQAEIFEQIGESIATGVSDALTDAVMGAKTLGEAAVAVLSNIKRQLVQLGINTLLFNIFGGEEGIFKNLPILNFANGGRPPVGKPSIVGEEGPEIFVPSSAGTIIPNNKIGGGGVVNNINISVDASGTSVEGDDASANQLGELIAAAVQTEIINQQMSGGLLS